MHSFRESSKKYRAAVSEIERNKAHAEQRYTKILDDNKKCQHSELSDLEKEKMSLAKQISTSNTVLQEASTRLSTVV